MPGGTLTEPKERRLETMQGSGVSTRLIVVYCFLIGLLVSLFGCGNPADEPLPDDRATAIPVIEAYVRALSKRDRDAIMALRIPADQKDESGVSDRLEKYGGVNPEQAKITIMEGATPWVPIAVIEVQRGGQPPMAWTENLYWDDDEWLLQLSERERGMGQHL